MKVVNFMLNDIKAALAVVMATISTGVGHLLDAIPDDIGKLATVVGIALSLVLIYTHVRRGQSESKQAAVDLERAKLELAFMVAKEAHRVERDREKRKRRDDD